MSEDALRSLRAAIKSRQFDSAYYIHGEDEYQKESAARELGHAAVDPEARAFNLEVRRASELDPEALDVLLSTLPMFSERRVVVIQDPSALKKLPRKILEKYLESPGPGTTLILIAPAGCKPERELMERSTELRFDPLTAKRTAKWIAHHARETHGASITPEAVELLQAAVGTDLHDLSAELDKLASFASGAEIDEAAVAAIVGVRHGETLADLMDAILDRNVGVALEILPRVLAQPKVTGVSIVMALANQTLAMSWGRAKLDRGMSPTALVSEYVGLLKSSGWLMLPRAFDPAARAWAGATPDWPMEALEHSLDALLDADVSLKDTRVASDEQILSGVVLKLCALEGNRLAA